ncbi:MAG: hypothetical protein IJR29_00185 [Butyrivibrio sp.]|nr:hypothetical protein [Butyrivibrio sp.]
MKENTDDSIFSRTAYDDAFRTMEGKCDDILIPFVGHMFGIQYGSGAKVKRLRNEHVIEHEDKADEKRITDSSFEISYNNITKKFHLECESKEYDGTILVRMFEYDSQIARENGEPGLYKIRFKFPNSGILLLRTSSKAPSVAKIELEMPDQNKISYDVPIMKMSDYDVETIFENRLYMLIPFYIFNYENQLQEMNGNKAMLDELILGYRYIFERLEKEQKMGNLSELSLSAIIKLTYRVAYKLTRKQEKVQEKVGEVMGGKVLDLPEFRIYDQGKAEGKAEGIAEGKAEGLAEGAKEREELKIENERLRRELEELKETKVN